ncbi:hypothetical protein [Pyxidicoccus caerfyrddinensis]|uniref:hypothetical protein n=1 Tax=Pyxidicoccus caerfyrddinensis TaxID=2709663 RepID=UPI0013DA6AF2|nr:hypothetical protein [Pyxidicoccus caerfyrddinensis]
MHRDTAAKPFELLQKIPSLEAPVRTVQTAHDLAVSGSYGMVRWVNRAVGGTLDVSMGLLEKRKPRA